MTSLLTRRKVIAIVYIIKKNFMTLSGQNFIIILQDCKCMILLNLDYFIVKKFLLERHEKIRTRLCNSGL